MSNIIVLLEPVSSPLRLSIPSLDRYPITYCPGSGGKRDPSGDK